MHRVLKKKKEGQESKLNRLPYAIRRKVNSYLVGDDEIKKFKQIKYFLSRDTFFFDLHVFSTIQATHNLLHRIKVNETLKLIQQNPRVLSISVEVKDIHGQRFRGKLLQVLASAGEFNPVEMKKGAKPYGLVPVLRSYFPNPNDYTSQLQEQFKPAELKHGEYKLATNTRMTRIKKAIQEFINDVIKSNDISEDVPFETLLNFEIAKKFRKAIKPDPDDVVTVGLGLAWDVQIFLDFIDMLETNPELGPMFSLKSDFVNAVVWPALQIQSPLCDLEVFAKGIGNVCDEQNPQMPDRFDFSNGVQKSLEGIGITACFSSYGTQFPLSRPQVQIGCGGGCWPPYYLKLISNKNTNMAQSMQPSTQARRRCLIL